MLPETEDFEPLFVSTEKLNFRVGKDYRSNLEYIFLLILNFETWALHGGGVALKKLRWNTALKRSKLNMHKCLETSLKLDGYTTEGTKAELISPASNFEQDLKHQMHPGRSPRFVTKWGKNDSNISNVIWHFGKWRRRMESIINPFWKKANFLSVE